MQGRLEERTRQLLGHREATCACAALGGMCQRAGHVKAWVLGSAGNAAAVGLSRIACHHFLLLQLRREQRGSQWCGRQAPQAVCLQLLVSGAAADQQAPTVNSPPAQYASV